MAARRTYFCLLAFIWSSALWCGLPETGVAQPFPDCELIQQVPSTECEAMVAFFNSTNGENWSFRGEWLRAHNVCEWFGVRCNSKSWPRNITHIELTNHNVSGSLPPELALLTELTNLVVSNRPSSGEILRLGGTLPAELGDLTGLEVLDLSHNEIREHIPDSYGALKNLRVLNLESNQLNDFLPATYGNMESLEVMNLSHNEIRGAIPASFGRLKQLIELNLSYNQLNGSIPDSLGYLPRLSSLDLESNELTGLIPRSLGKLPSLIRMSLAHNQLRGPLSPEVAALGTSLNYCSLENSGPRFCIPDNDLFQPASDGTICGVAPDASCRFCPPSDPQCSALETLYYTTRGPEWIDNTGWLVHDSPCEWFGISCDQNEVVRLDLRQNNLKGPLPSDLGSMNKLDILDLSDNQLAGPVPFTIAALGANIASCSLTRNTASFCMPGDVEYASLGRQEICGLPLDAACTANFDVQITVFEAQPDGSSVRFKWTTNRSQSGTIYEIESKRGDAFDVIDTFMETATSAESKTIERMVSGLSEGLHTFRLKQTHPNGSISFSAEADLVIGSRSSLLVDGVFPNPSSGTARFRFAITEEQHVEVLLFDALGRRVRTLLSDTLPANQALTLDVQRQNLPSGLYFLQISGAAFHAVQPFVFTR